jgi:transcriptional regulator with XRE-family HTH domain
MRHQDFSQTTVQQQFAANMRRNYISSVERAERNISLKNIERIAFALDVSMAALVAGALV